MGVGGGRISQGEAAVHGQRQPPGFDEVPKVGDHGRHQRANLGDVEAEAALMWLDTFGPTPRRERDGVRVRSTVGIGYRLATGPLDATFDYFDLAPGSGRSALLVRSATDVAIGCTAMLEAVNLALFELGAWQNMSSVGRIKYDESATERY